LFPYPGHPGSNGQVQLAREGNLRLLRFWLAMTVKVARNDDRPCVELYLQRFYFKALADIIAYD